MTVDVMTARVLLGDAMVKFADLPGIYSLEGHSDDEALVQRFLATAPLSAIVAVLNATRVELQLPLVLALKATGVPLLVVLNMADEATQLGIAIDAPRLAAELGSPVVPVSAKYGQGMDEAKRALATLVAARPDPVVAISRRCRRVKRASVRPRASRRLRAHALVLPPGITARLDRALLHPWLGIPLFLLAMFAVFQAVFGLGVPLQDGTKWLLDALKTGVIAPGRPPRRWFGASSSTASSTASAPSPRSCRSWRYSSARWRSSRTRATCARRLAHGCADEPSRTRRPRVRDAADGLRLQRPGADGTRVLRNRAARLLSMLVIPFSLCSARLQVFLFLTTAVFSPWLHRSCCSRSMSRASPPRS